MPWFPHLETVDYGSADLAGREEEIRGIYVKCSEPQAREHHRRPFCYCHGSPHRPAWSLSRSLSFTSSLSEAGTACHQGGVHAAFRRVGGTRAREDLFVWAGPTSPRRLLRGSPVLLNSPLLGTAVPLHGQFDVGGTSRPPGIQSPEDREHGAHQKARGLLPTAPPPSPGPVSQTECKPRPGGQTRDWKARGLGVACL